MSMCAKNCIPTSFYFSQKFFVSLETNLEFSVMTTKKWQFNEFTIVLSDSNDYHEERKVRFVLSGQPQF